MSNISTEVAPSRITATAGSVPVRRSKDVRRSVLIIDRLADRIITIGGIAVIVAVLGILVFLVEETLPLFRGGHVTADHAYHLANTPDSVLALGMDEHKTIAYIISPDGTLALFHARSGKPLHAPTLDFKRQKISAFAQTINQRHLAFGLQDGTVRLARTQFKAAIVTSQELPANLTALDGRDQTDGTTVYSSIPGGQFRKIVFDLQLEPALNVAPAGTPIVAIDYRVGGEAERQSKAFVTVDGAGAMMLNQVTSRINLLTGKRRVAVKKAQLPDLPADTQLHAILLAEKADMVLIGSKQGRIYRYDTRDFQKPVLVESAPVISDSTSLSLMRFLFGGQSILIGDSTGSLDIFFLMQRPEHGTIDKRALVNARSFEKNQTPYVRFSPSVRDKSFAVIDAAGQLKILHGTSQKTLGQYASTDDKPAVGLTLAPRLDGVMQLGRDGAVRFAEFEVPHPETTFKTLFRKVWYEGYEQPTFTWQSSAATDDFEPKLSLIPLIFGSVKAALYSLFFAVPIAILGAIYTSEFVNPSVRATLKPAMEMMASLPSVVLGFVAALVLAPIVETWIAAVVLSFIVVPVSLMAGAYLWQLLPIHLANRWQGLPKFFLICAVVVLALIVTRPLGAPFERLFFQGDFKAWLNGQSGTAQPFLFLMLMPIVFLGLAALITRFFGRAIRVYQARLSPLQTALMEIVKWLLLSMASIVGAYILAWLGTLVGIDARGNIVDTYVQRNTLVVGFAMGFAVIPIIYTIAEDALNAVPEHLRAASLGCGATPWQTALYVILPTAVSGVFSAVMIGMGRAVGETMIVVMAAGNTPLMDWNIFNGLRALSATIAVELPEAVKGGTLYRVLFLSGLVLFAMTFVINTVAEVVRLRFRKRATQL